MNVFPFEVHLTLPAVTPTQEFVDVCKELGCKPIILDLDGEQQVTTSSVYKCTLQEIGGHAENLVDRFKAKGYDVIRTKIETVPWHPVAKAYRAKGKRSDHYFESHLTYDVRSADELYKLRMYAKLYGMHISKNALKPTENTIKIMGTIRSFSAAEDHNFKVTSTLMYILNSLNIHPTKVVTEFAIMDTNTALDNKWMKK